MIDQLPEAARRALALRAAFEAFGFDLDREIFITPLTLVNEPAPPPGSVHLATVLALSGDPTRASFIAFAGHIERAWWEGPGRKAMATAWNRLTDPQRDDERRRFVPLLDFYRMAHSLIERGIVPPAMAEMIPHGRN